MSTDIKKWRLEAQKTTEDAAKAVGVTVAMWSRFENGRRRVPAERVLQIEKLTGISRYDLRPDVFGPSPEAAE